MKILKHGDLKPRRFTCKNCGCEFVADMSEYEVAYCDHEKCYCVDCPECKHYAYVAAFISEIYHREYDNEV